MRQTWRSTYLSRISWMYRVHLLFHRRKCHSLRMIFKLSYYWLQAKVDNWHQLFRKFSSLSVTLLISERCHFINTTSPPFYLGRGEGTVTLRLQQPFMGNRMIWLEVFRGASWFVIFWSTLLTVRELPMVNFWFLSCL